MRTVVFAPAVAEQAVMGNDMMARDRVDEVVQQSFFAAGARATDSRVRELLRIAAG